MAVQIGPSDSDGINEINITPFVDIVLVLLIIFMISTPAMVYRGLRVSLPSAVNAEDLSHVTLSLSITKEGETYLDSRKISHSDLVKVYEKLKITNTSNDAIISADALVPHGKVMELSDTLRSLGVAQVGFAAKPLGKRK